MRTRTGVTRLIGGVAIAAAMCSMIGCMSGATRDGTSYSYAPTGLSSHLPYSIDRVFDAAKVAAEQDLRYTIDEARSDAMEGRIVARGARDNVRRITLKRSGDNVTEVSIFVGPLGDRAQSREILNRIERRLRTSTRGA